ncbi:hypothetical protein TNCV_2113471 [Trichonephila clavipes]|nr:hypothetical protein TNCV_2113471 [Trichonephila clavipes]
MVQDGAPSLFYSPVRDRLNMAYISTGSDVIVRLYGQHDHQILHLARLHAYCASVDTAQLLQELSSIPLRTQACLDNHAGHFKYLPF